VLVKEELLVVGDAPIFVFKLMKYKEKIFLN